MAEQTGAYVSSLDAGLIFPPEPNYCQEAGWCCGVALLTRRDVSEHMAAWHRGHRRPAAATKPEDAARHG